MFRIRSKDTKPEMMVRRILWGHCFRCRVHSMAVLEIPDTSNRRQIPGISWTAASGRGA